jgi:hypothetical protein
MYTLREVARLKALVFLVIGTVGLLVNEFAFDWGRAATSAFAALNVVGLITLVFTNWGTKKE